MSESALDSFYYEAFDQIGVDLERGSQLANAYFTEANRSKSASQIAYAYDLKGLAAFYADKVDSAFYYAAKSIQAFRKLGTDSFGLSTAIYNRSLYHHYLGNYQATLSDLHLSREIDTRSGSIVENNIFYFQMLADVVFDQMNPELAVRYLARSESALIALPGYHDYMRSELYLSYAWVFIELGLYDQAEYYAKKGYQESLEAGAVSGRSSALLVLSKVQSQKGNHPLALNYARKALSYDRAYGDAYGVTYTQSFLASRLQDAGQMKLASAHFDTVEAKFLKFPNPVMHIDIAKELVHFYKAKGDKSKALKYLEIKDSTQALVNKADALAAMQQFDEELKSRKDQIALTKARLQEEELTRKNAILIGLASFSLVLILFALILFGGSKKLKSINKQLEAKQQKIIKQAEDLKGKSLALEEKNQALEKINQSKDRLFSILTHDLRQPFGQIKSVIELLEQKALSPQEEHELLNDLKDSVDDTGSLVSNVLMWSKAQFAGVSINPENFSLANAVKRSLLHYQISLDKKGIEINLAVPNGLEIYFDPDHFASVFRNILTNAMKYSPQGACIHIWASERSESVELRIKDEGMGMSKEQREAILAARSLNSIPGTLNEVGTGIGLLIVNQLLEENQATYSIESEVDDGTSFILQLPKAQKTGEQESKSPDSRPVRSLGN